jgi:hypothetical protein
VSFKAGIMGELRLRKPLVSLPPPMRRFVTPSRRLRLLVCALLGTALLVATGQYLSHFHVPQLADVHAEEGSDQASDQTSDHAADEQCSLCLQFDRLPASPGPAQSPVAFFFHVATLEAQRLERLALDLPLLWPPSRGPPVPNC